MTPERTTTRFALLLVLAGLVIVLLVDCSTLPTESVSWPSDTPWHADTFAYGSGSAVVIDGFEGPFGITVAGDGTLYVPDIWRGQVVRFTAEYQPQGWLGMFDGMTRVIDGWHEIGRPCRCDQCGGFDMAHSVTFDAAGDLLIADYGSGRIAKYSPDGTFQGCVFDLPNLNGLAFKGSANAWYDPDFNLWVADFDLHRIYKFEADGELVGWMGELTDGSPTDGFVQSGLSQASAALRGFDRPQMVRTDSKGNFYVVEIGNHRIQKFTPSGELIGWLGAFSDGNPTGGWATNGLSGETNLPGGFCNPTSIFFLPGDTMIICDNGNSRLQKFAPDGTFLSWLGGRAEGGVTNGWATDGLSAGGEAPGAFLYPYDAVVHDGKLYVADGHNGRVQILDIRSSAP